MLAQLEVTVISLLFIIVDNTIQKVWWLGAFSDLYMPVGAHLAELHTKTFPFCYIFPRQYLIMIMTKLIIL